MFVAILSEHFKQISIADDELQNSDNRIDYLGGQ